MIAALYVETDGCYFGLPDVDPYDIHRDARNYTGRWPVVAHPPCKRWGKFWHGSPSAPRRYGKGEDGGCFASALTSARNHGGVIEHPVGSSAWEWEWFGLEKPRASQGWTDPDRYGGRSISVEQGWFGHAAPKPTLLYAVGIVYPDLPRGRSPATGSIEDMGGGGNDAGRNATPLEFRDLLLSMARSVHEAFA